MHMDLKSPNILLSRHGVAKLADVGLAKVIRDRNYITQVSVIGADSNSPPAPNPFPLQCLARPGPPPSGFHGLHPVQPSAEDDFQLGGWHWLSCAVLTHDFQEGPQPEHIVRCGGTS